MVSHQGHHRGQQQLPDPGRFTKPLNHPTSGNGKGHIFVKDQIIKTAPEHQIVETLIEEAMRIAEEAGESAETGSPTVTVG